LRTKTTGSPISVIVEEVEGAPRLLLEAEENNLKCTLINEGAELVAGIQRWAEGLEEGGWITTQQQSSETRKPQQWEDLVDQINTGYYCSIHATFVGKAHLENTIKILLALHNHVDKGGLLSFESPITADIWNNTDIIEFANFNDLHYSTTDKCRWGLGSQGRTRLCSNIPRLQLKEIEGKSCTCANKPHNRLKSRFLYTEEKGWSIMRRKEGGRKEVGFGNRRKHDIKISENNQPRHLAAALARAHHRTWTKQVLEIKNQTATIRSINIKTNAQREFNTIDSGAEKHFVRVGEEGNWNETGISGLIHCSGFNNKTDTFNLGRAEAVVMTTNGRQVILEAKQAVMHERSDVSSLIDPSAIAAAGWKVNIDFIKSTGTLEYGEDIIKLVHQETGIGFHSRQPTAAERRNLKRIPLSNTDYNKKKYLNEGGKSRSEWNQSKY
jgi:hypothetical protein